MTKAGVYTKEPLFIFTHGQKSFSMAAVDFFFVISGFLVVRSWLRSKSMQDYFHRRVLRIHPGYIVALIVSLALAMATTSPSEYLSKLPIARFILSFINLEYGALDAPKMAFASTPLPVVNASLWTIQMEFLAYIGVAVYGLFGLYQYRKLYLVVAGAYIAWSMQMIFQGHDVQSGWGFGCFFVVGATYYLFRDFIPRSRLLFFFALALLIAGSFVKPWFTIGLFLVAPYLLFYIAFLPAPRWAGWTSKVDLSYGTYLYAWVIQESLIYWLHIRHPYTLFALALPLTLLCAAFSWFLVERLCLRLKSLDFKDRDVASPENQPSIVS